MWQAAGVVCMLWVVCGRWWWQAAGSRGSEGRKNLRCSQEGRRPFRAPRSLWHETRRPVRRRPNVTATRDRYTEALIYYRHRTFKLLFQRALRPEGTAAPNRRRREISSPCPAIHQNAHGMKSRKRTYVLFCKERTVHKIQI